MLDEVSLDVSISHRLGRELIDAAREVVQAWHEADAAKARLCAAMLDLERLVGSNDR